MGTGLAQAVGRTGPPARVSACYDPVEERSSKVASELGATTCSSLDELLALDSVDAVIVATPNHLHEEHVLAAAAAGKHVFCEKPMALSVDQCTRMLDACRQAGVKLMVGQVLRYIGPFALLRKVVADGEIGEPKAMATVRLGGRGWGGFSSDWRSSEDMTGGVIFEVNVHELDLQRTILGEPLEVYAAAGSYASNSELAYPDLYSVTTKFEQGRVGQLLAGMCTPIGTYHGRLIGSEGSAWFPGWGELHVQRWDEELRVLTPPEGGPSPVEQEVGDFVRAIVDDTEPAVPGEEGRRSVAFCQAVVESARLGVAVSPVRCD